MDAVRVNAVPVFCGDEMPKPVGVAVRHKLRITRRAGGEKQQHRVLTAGCVLGALKA